MAGVAALCGACATGSAFNSEQRTIVVDGAATIQVVPDKFTVSAGLLSRNPDQAAGLAELSQKLAEVRRTIPQLEGLRQVEIDASEMQLVSVMDPSCVEAADYSNRINCPVTGRLGSITLVVRGSPSSRAGQVISLLSQLGADMVELGGFSVSNIADAKNKALEAAVADARAKAEAIARSTGATISGLAKVQYGRGFGGDRYLDDAFSIQAMYQEPPGVSTTVRPVVDLDLDPSPVDVDARVTAAFSVR